MAGDWIKMRTALANDPSVIAMACTLDVDEFEVVGMLHHLWSWADAQSRDGHVPGVTKKWIDRYVHRDGFANAMCAAGWLVVDEAGIQFPHFERHNGKPAKDRALAGERQRKKRASVTPPVTDVSRGDSDTTVTREEKRREENKEHGGEAALPPAAIEPPPPTSKTKRKTALPAEFPITADMIVWANERAPAAELSLETEKFLNHFRAKGEVRADWLASWRNWMLNAQTYAGRRVVPMGKAAGPDFDDLSWTRDLGGL